MSRALSAATLAFAAAALTVAALPLTAHAGAEHRSAGKFGLGLGGGTNTGGISAKMFLSDASAIQAVVGAYGNWENGTGLGLNADYLYEMPAIADVEAVEIAWNLGAGAGLGGNSKSNALSVGVSGVAGLEFAFKPVPLDLVIEYRPTLHVVPKVELGLVNFTGHLRWFF
jgi:hypothetical protein